MEHQTLRRAVLGLFSLSVLGGLLLVNQPTKAHSSPTTMAVVYIPYLQDGDKNHDKVPVHSNKRGTPPCKTEPPVQTHKSAPPDPFKQLLRGIMI